MVVVGCTSGDADDILALKGIDALGRSTADIVGTGRDVPPLPIGVPISLGRTIDKGADVTAIYCGAELVLRVRTVEL